LVSLIIASISYTFGGEAKIVKDELDLNIHLMHPGLDSEPADPNAAIYVDGTYHMHYIVAHPYEWKDGKKGNSFSFVHITSKDMLNWSWEPTTLQPSFTGHGMFSGTAFFTKEGKPAIIYHGQGSSRNQIVVASDRSLNKWEAPYAMTVKGDDGEEVSFRHWDPDCFLIGDTYYALSGGGDPPLVKSKDLKNWTFVGPFFKNELPNTIKGEDVSCANFFKLGDKWVLLCISHHLGCRYYIGDWDHDTEQFVPQRHGRMNWRREDRELKEEHRDFFAPESLLTPDGRRVMWAWLASLDEKSQDAVLIKKSIQSLPRELSIAADGTLRIKPLRELQALRKAPIVMENVRLPGFRNNNTFLKKDKSNLLAELKSDTIEIKLTIDRKEAERKRFGIHLFATEKDQGLPILIRPETATIRVGKTEAPFNISDLPKGEDLTLHIFIDKYLVEVFVNDRQALLASYMDWEKSNTLMGYSFSAPTIFKKIEMWPLTPVNDGFKKALKHPVWQFDSK